MLTYRVEVVDGFYKLIHIVSIYDKYNTSMLTVTDFYTDSLVLGLNKGNFIIGVF